MRMLFAVFGLLSLANGLWMLFAPEAWYHDLPAGVPDTGPLNLHFVRDIGAVFTTFGVAFLVTAPQAHRNRSVLLMAAMFYVLHAVIHVADLASGRLPAGHWVIDFPGVFLPALLLLVLGLPRWWTPAAR